MSLQSLIITIIYKSGDIMYIDIDKAIPKSNKLKRFTELHSRSVFGIDIVDDGRFAISHSMDRSVSL